MSRSSPVAPKRPRVVRLGQRDNLEALATFFGVPPAYFFDDEVAAQLSPQLHLLVALRDSSVRDIALRVAELSPDSLDAIRGMIEQVSQQAEGRVPSGGSNGWSDDSELFELPPSDDLAGEAAWLAQIARAYVRSPVG